MVVNRWMACKRDRQLIRREVQVHSSLAHPNITPLHYVYDTPKAVYLVMEYTRAKLLLEYLQEHKRLSEDQARCIILQILDALGYCLMQQVGNASGDRKSVSHVNLLHLMN